MTANKIISTGAALGALGVVAGAFGAHAIREKVEPRLYDVFQTGCHYLQMHSFAIIAYGLWLTTAAAIANQPKPIPFYLFLIGMVLFSGSLFAMTATGIRALGAITPLGGLSFIAAWCVFAWQAWNAQN